jgi:lambda family phage tail tape measure protein
MTDLAAAKLAHTQELLNRAKQAGIALTPQQTAELTKLGGAMGAAEIATKRMKDAYATVKDAVKGFLSTFTSAIEQGKSLWQAFGAAAKSVLDKIIDKIEDQLSTAITNALFSGGKSASGGGGGGLFGGIIGAIGSLLGFASGGYTGRGGASQVAGVVHGGEYVFSKRATDRIGVGNLDAIHSRARGYAAGGHVATLPRVQAPANDRGSGDMNINVTVNGARGNQEIQTMVASGVREGLSKYDKNLPNRLNQYNERGI